MLRKYMNYIIFAAVALLIVGIAVNHSRKMRSLITAMTSNDKTVQRNAALELIKAEQFLDTISGEQPEVKVKAAESLEYVAEDTSLVKGTAKDAQDYRAVAVKQALSMLKDLKAPVRARALQTLQRSGALTASNLKELVNGLKDGDNYVRTGTITALTHPEKGIGPKVDAAAGVDVIAAVTDIMKREAGARGTGGDVLSHPTFRQGANRSKSAGLLIALLSEKDGGIKRGASDALGKLGDLSAVQPLKTLATDDPDPQVRRVALGALALIADKSCEDYLVKAVLDKEFDNEARAQAASGLGKIASPLAIKTLITALSDDDLKLRTAASGALARAGRPNIQGAVNKNVVAALVATLKGSNEASRILAADALRIIATPEANSALIAVLKNPAYSRDARSAAAGALGFAGNTGGADALVTALADKEGDVTVAAKDALSKLGTPAIAKLSAILQSDGSGAILAAQALSAMGTDALPALSQLAKKGNPASQRWSAVALGDLGKAGVSEARELLRTLSQSSDENVKFVATEQLRRLGI